MPVDQYLWKICAEDRETLAIGLRLLRSPEPGVAELGVGVATLARRSLRRRAREWLRLERRHVAELGYEDLGGEAADFSLENSRRAIVTPSRALTSARADAYRRSMPDPARTVSRVAGEILSLWSRPDPGALPYLEAMLSMDYSSFTHPDSPTLERMYGAEPSRDVVARFLANASTFRGEDARRIKGELREILRRK